MTATQTLSIISGKIDALDKRIEKLDLKIEKLDGRIWAMLFILVIMILGLYATIIFHK